MLVKKKLFKYLWVTVTDLSKDLDSFAKYPRDVSDESPLFAGSSLDIQLFQ